MKMIPLFFSVLLSCWIFILESSRTEAVGGSEGGSKPKKLTQSASKKVASASKKGGTCIEKVAEARSPLRASNYGDLTEVFIALEENEGNIERTAQTLSDAREAAITSQDVRRFLPSALRHTRPAVREGRKRTYVPNINFLNHEQIEFLRGVFQRDSYLIDHIDLFEEYDHFAEAVERSEDEELGIEHPTVLDRRAYPKGFEAKRYEPVVSVSVIRNLPSARIQWDRFNSIKKVFSTRPASFMNLAAAQKDEMLMGFSHLTAAQLTELEDIHPDTFSWFISLYQEEITATKKRMASSTPKKQ